MSLSKLAHALPVALNTVILLFSISVGYSAINLRIYPPEDVSWGVKNGVLYMNTSFGVDNKGFFDIENITMHVTIVNSSGYLISSNTIWLGDVPRGTFKWKNISISINLTELLISRLTFNLFHDDVFLVNVSVTGGYAKFFGFELSSTQEMEWSAPLKGFNIEIGEVAFSPEGLEIKLDIRHEGWMTCSNIPVKTIIEIVGDGKSESEGIIPEIKSGENRIPLRVNITPEMARTLLLEDRDLKITVETPAINISKYIKWKALMGDLKIRRVRQTDYGAYVHLTFRISFKNNGLCDLNVNSVARLLDESGNEIARKNLKISVRKGGSYSKDLTFVVPRNKVTHVSVLSIDITDPAPVHMEFPVG